MRFRGGTSVIRYCGVVITALTATALAVAFAIPASLHAVDAQSANALAMRADYGKPLPQLAASDLNINRMLAVRIEKPEPRAQTTEPVASAAEQSVTQKVAMLPTYRIEASSLNVRSEASSKSRIVASLPQAAEVQVLERKAGWLRIEAQGQSLGWVFEKYLAPVNATDERTAELR